MAQVVFPGKDSGGVFHRPSIEFLVHGPHQSLSLALGTCCSLDCKLSDAASTNCRWKRRWSCTVHCRYVLTSKREKEGKLAKQHPFFLFGCDFIPCILVTCVQWRRLPFFPSGHNAFFFQTQPVVAFRWLILMNSLVCCDHLLDRQRFILSLSTGANPAIRP